MTETQGWLLIAVFSLSYAGGVLEKSKNEAAPFGAFANYLVILLIGVCALATAVFALAANHLGLSGVF